MVVIMAVLTNSIFCFSLPIDQLMATEIPVRGIIMRLAAVLRDNYSPCFCVNYRKEIRPDKMSHLRFAKTAFH